MSISREEAYHILKVPCDATDDEIRTSYCRLATQYYPSLSEKDDSEATTELKRLYASFHLLKGDDDNFTEEEIQHLFTANLLRESIPFGIELNLSDDEDDSEDFDTDDEVMACEHWQKIEQQAHENAQKLMDEEEQERKKLEKKRERRKKHKQRRKEKKREEKGVKKEQNSESYEIKEISNDAEQVEHTSNNDDASPKKKKPEENDSDIDLGSAFCSKVKQKVQKVESSRSRKASEKSQTEPTKANKPASAPSTPSPPSAPDAENGVESEGEVISAEASYKSQEHARKGNELAQFGKLHNAIDEYTKAISLNKKDHRCFGNRSYCYHSLKKFNEALSDANSAISLVPHEPKGYFRKAKALCGLKRFNEAENALNKILELDPDCSEASHELFEVRLMQLQDFGFDRRACEHALIKSKNDIQGAIECLLSSQFQDNMSFSGNGGSDFTEMNTSPTPVPAAGVPPAAPGQPYIYSPHPPTPISTFYPVINPVYNSAPIRILSVAAPGARPAMMTAAPYPNIAFQRPPLPPAMPNHIAPPHPPPNVPTIHPMHKPLQKTHHHHLSKVPPPEVTIQPNTVAVRSLRHPNANPIHAGGDRVLPPAPKTCKPASAAAVVVVPTAQSHTAHDPPRKFDPRDYSLWIGHFDSKKITEKDLYNVFTKYGKVSGVVIIKTHGKPLAYSFIHFMKHEDAKRAFNASQNHIIQGVSLDVNWNKNPTIECEHWLRGHCPYNNCHYLHVSDHQYTTSR